MRLRRKYCEIDYAFESHSSAEMYVRGAAAEKIIAMQNVPMKIFSRAT